ncbi:MAG: TIGR02265 family protein [Polyangiaceae bacterium]
MSDIAHRKALDLVGPCCDIEERLRDVPPSARVRGLYFRSVLNVLRDLNRFDAYERYFPNEKWSSLALYPLGDYLLRLAVAGAVVASPENLHHGVQQITRRNATAFATSLLGKVLVRILARDPVRLTEQGLAARRQSTTYGEWELVRKGPREIEMVYHAEYMWIESAIAGAALGSFESCQTTPRIETLLRDKYNGSTVVRW